MMKRNIALEIIARRRKTSVLVVMRTRSVASMYTAKHADAARAIASPQPRLKWRERSPETMTTHPATARNNPSQKSRLGRWRKIIQLSSPTKTGVLLPSKVAFAADVRRIEVLKNARSRAKKRPPRAMTISVFGLTRGDLPPTNHVGTSKTAGMSMR